LALDVVTAHGIVNAVSTDAACRATIEEPQRSKVVMELLGLWHVAGGDGFTGCPTVQQVLELNKEPWKSELAQETNGMDSWGAPYQILCDQGQVLVFSLGPDKQAGTADDITSVL
jgi:hypothetical protein